jgi:hypothetical protein
VWDIIITRILGHAAARSIFREPPEDKAKRIAEEKRKERERFLRELPWIILTLIIFAVVCYFVWLWFLANIRT